MTASLRCSDRQRVAARRAVVRHLHPDRGGDPEVFIAALALTDAAYGDQSTGAPLVVVKVRHARRRRIRAAITRSVRRFSGTRRRYAQL